MLPTYQKAALVARLADEKKAENIQLLDVSGLCNFTDVFMICTANNRVQLQAICGGIAEGFKKIGLRAPKEDGSRGANWIVLDFGDVVAHVMNAEARSFYRLEALWGDAQDLDWVEIASELPEAAGSTA